MNLKGLNFYNPILMVFLLLFIHYFVDSYLHVVQSNNNISIRSQWVLSRIDNYSLDDITKTVLDEIVKFLKRSINNRWEVLE
jgi:hypothetical protein